MLAERASGNGPRLPRARSDARTRGCIKALHDVTGRGDLLAEARSASALNHPNICTIYELGDVDGTAFIAMELVEGRPLSELIAADELPGGTALRFAVQIAGALAHAHQHGVVHGDLKGQNVLLTPHGVAKLVDFGLARRLSPASLESLTRTGAADAGVAGTLPYMAPETIRGAPLTPAADVWAFGVLLQEMLTGARPFTGGNAYELAAAILGETPRPLRVSAPPGTATVIARCLEKDSAARYATARELFVALEPLVSVPADAAPAHSGDTRRRRIGPLALVAATAAAVLLAGTLLWRWTQATEARRPRRRPEHVAHRAAVRQSLRQQRRRLFRRRHDGGAHQRLSRSPTLTVIAVFLASLQGTRQVVTGAQAGARRPCHRRRDSRAVPQPGANRRRLVDAASDRNCGRTTTPAS